MMSESNIIANVHQFINWGWGQNYPFNGAVSFLLESIGENPEIYDYWFFSGVSGDIFTMCYGNNDDFNDCVSVCSNGIENIKLVFEAIGYEFEYINQKELNSNKEKYIQKVIEYIDKGIPVLQRGKPDNANYDIIYQYSDNGKILYSMVGDEEYKDTINTEKIIEHNWIFIGNKTKDCSMASVYREAILRIPYWLNHPKTPTGVSFGAQAFYDWADDIEKGRYDSLQQDTFDPWKHYHIYVCNLATNSGGGQSFLDKAYEYNPDLTFIPKVKEQYLKTEVLWKELEEIGGGFNATLETLQNVDKRQLIASKIREFGKCSEKVYSLVIPYMKQKV